MSDATSVVNYACKEHSKYETTRGQRTSLRFSITVSPPRPLGGTWGVRPFLLPQYEIVSEYPANGMASALTETKE